MTNKITKVYKNGVEYDIYASGGASMSTATSSTAGVIKLGSDTVQTTAANTPSSTASRTYPVQLNGSNQAVVNVPWENTTYTLGTAASKNTGTTSGTVPLINNSGKLETSIVPDVHADAVSSVNGRTGAVNGLQDEHSSISVTLSSSGWSSNSQTVTATGVTASNTVIVSPAPASFTDYTNASIYASAQGSNSLTFTSGKTPSSNITVNVLILN